MISNRPYLLRAFYQWIVDSRCTPILVVDASYPDCELPTEFAESGELVLNISPAAVLELKITNQHVQFRASFSGVSHLIAAPVGAVLAIYAEENGEGLFLDAEEDLGGDAAGAAKIQADRVQLRGIDGSNAEPLDSYSMNAPAVPAPPKPKPVLKLVE